MRLMICKSVAISLVLSGAAQAQGPQRATEVRAVEAVLSRYKAAVEKLDAKGTEQLFTPNAQVFETGGSEGSYLDYLSHHLGPELAQFRSFQYSDYKVAVRFVGPIAIATETYRYRIEPKNGEVAERLGVATSVLEKSGSTWRISLMHNSARRPKPN